MQLIGVTKFWIGLSTDTKPTSADAGDLFYESDTKDKYIYGETGWTTLPDSLTEAGRLQIISTTEDLNQPAGNYDLFTGTDDAVILERLNLKMPTGGASSGTLTSISIQTDDATPGTIISAASGAVANLVSEADLAWSGNLLVNIGTKIRLTIAGGANGSTCTSTIVVQYRAIEDGGKLAV